MINHLEGNLDRMESRLHNLGFPVDDEVFAADPSPQTLLDDSQGPDAAQDLLNIYPSPQPDATAPDVNPRILPPFKKRPSPPAAAPPCFDVPRYLGGILSTGSFSMISREGMEWISQKAGIDSMQSLMDLASSGDGGFEADYPLYGISPRRTFCPLPPQQDIMRLLQKYVEYFNVLFPIFKQSELLSLFAEEGVQMWSQSAGGWASINVILAVAYMLPGNGAGDQPDHEKSSLFLKAALEVVNELYLGPPDIRGLQALLTMTILFLSAAASRPCNFLISVAIHISDQLGLGRADIPPIFSPEEARHGQTIFWFAYCLDREISVRFGQPPVQSDEAVSAALPMDAPASDTYAMPTSGQPGTFNAFRSACELARIRGHVYQDLYSAPAVKRPFDQILASVGQLDEQLQAWKKSIPSEYQPDSRSIAPPVSAILVHLHHTYYNCMIAIHSLVAARGINSAQDLMDINGLSFRPDSFSNPRVLLSASLISKAARASINLIKYLPRDDISLGITMYYPTIALKTLASSIVRNPRDTCQIYNMRILDQAESFLSSNPWKTASEGMQRLVKQCAEYRSVAERAMKEAF
ncbi:hypothetical protein BO70DRAFT_386049 [Aspergillus heteromorphus CBS 117.55]|uniref:Xylanolytic transcriptional activator regulatory domain-containing protein n=1 Tax=Aspergillus heteromorphus CBS 117.55 TaxID=1448321 RepID=A0A317WM15_9EURO|nr:uncharacterized protein BO70DRAFT_386049 [Aspergillus heteromorphus CBS 117.55]PWY86731.1 hypothetical protein BO70DRAFT_386049 [Aspergillus heteromorphus CBS 117.55]